MLHVTWRQRQEVDRSITRRNSMLRTANSSRVRGKCIDTHDTTTLTGGAVDKEDLVEATVRLDLRCTLAFDGARLTC
jgi:hypothetical protein